MLATGEMWVIMVSCLVKSFRLKICISEFSKPTASTDASVENAKVNKLTYS